MTTYTEALAIVSEDSTNLADQELALMPFLVGGPCKGCGLPLARADVTGVTGTCALDPTVTLLVQKPGTGWLREGRREK